MRAMYERNEISAKDIKIFLECLSMALEEVQKYLLDIHCILLNPEYIFYEEEQFYFCYYPPKTSELWKDLHELTEYFVKHADYQDEESVQTIFFLHTAQMPFLSIRPQNGHTGGYNRSKIRLCVLPGLCICSVRFCFVSFPEILPHSLQSSNIFLPLSPQYTTDSGYKEASGPAKEE